MKHLYALLCVAFFASPAFAYDCNQSLKYKSEYASLTKTPPVDVESLKLGVAFLVDRRNITPTAATNEVIAILKNGKSPIATQLEEAISGSANQLKAANPQSEQECLALMDQRREHRRLGQQLTKYQVARLMAAQPAKQLSAPECKSQKLPEDHTSEMCLIKGANFDHMYFRLRVDGLEIFTLADDYAEDVVLKHKVSRSVSIEFPLSLQGPEESTIRGGCLPGSKDGALTAYICNFTWGQVQLVNNLEFQIH
ncbi:hypothetical protein [Xanthomonas campestris]|uniref:hypothetical protein n=1 Tax=Xanthomonas campestris TaxID=339 RepID=UPI003CFB6C85